MSRSPVNEPDAPSAVLWLVDGREVSDEDVALFASRLGPSEADRHARFVRPERRRQFVLGRMLLRLAAGCQTGMPVSAIDIVEQPGSAPRLLFPGSSRPPPAFSISHSGDWVGCVVSSDTALGLDLETVDPERDFLAIGQSAFHPDEHAWLAAQPGSGRMHAFYRLWSMREALYKLLSVNGGGPVPAVADPAAGPLSRGPGWHCVTLPHHELALAVCSAQALGELKVVESDGLTGSVREIDAG